MAFKFKLSDKLDEYRLDLTDCSLDSMSDAANLCTVCVIQFYFGHDRCADLFLCLAPYHDQHPRPVSRDAQESVSDYDWELVNETQKTECQSCGPRIDVFALFV